MLCVRKISKVSTFQSIQLSENLSIYVPTQKM